MNKPSVPITERRYVVPLILVTSLFFLWAFGVNLNDILIPHLKKAFHLTDFRSSLIQTAFFGGYFLAALPAGWLMEKIGYKRGILVGLLACADRSLAVHSRSVDKAIRILPVCAFCHGCAARGSGGGGESICDDSWTAGEFRTSLEPGAVVQLGGRGGDSDRWRSLHPLRSGVFPCAASRHDSRPIAGVSSSRGRDRQTALPGDCGTLLAVAALIFFSHLPEVREEERQRRTVR